MRDLQTAQERGLHFDANAAEFAFSFFREVLRLNGGEFEGQSFELEPWQAFIVGSLFGWRRADGTRRYRVAYVETAKGSGKSPLAGGIGLFGLVADGEYRAEVYAAATKKDQAMVLFRDAVAMVDQSPELGRRVRKSGVGERVWNLAYHATGSFFRPISADDGQSGPRPHISLLDEIHEHKDGYVVEMLSAGQKGRRSPLMFMITNSGTSRQSVCWEYHDYGAKVSAGTLQDDTFFGYVCANDVDDKGKEIDPFDHPEEWAKTNPSLGVTIQREYLEKQIREARGMPSKEATVRRLNFCQWVESASPWISGAIWLGLGRDYSLEQYRGRRAWGGLDLSSTTDLTSLVLWIEPQGPDDPWRMVPFFWIPGDNLMERVKKDRVPYDVWIKAGHIETTEGSAVDKLAVCRRIVQLADVVAIQEIAYDRWRIEDLKQAAISNDIVLPPLAAFGQGFASMSPALAEFEARILNGQVVHNNNPCLTWNAANAVTVQDDAENKKLSKSKATGRIDGIVAATMGCGRTIAEQAPPPITVESWFL